MITSRFSGLECISNKYLISNRGVVVVIVWQLDLQLPMQSVPITTKVVNSNPAHGEVYSIQHCDKVCR